MLSVKTLNISRRDALYVTNAIQVSVDVCVWVICNFFCSAVMPEHSIGSKAL